MWDYANFNKNAIVFNARKSLSTRTEFGYPIYDVRWGRGFSIRIQPQVVIPKRIQHSHKSANASSKKGHEARLGEAGVMFGAALNLSSLLTFPVWESAVNCHP